MDSRSRSPAKDTSGLGAEADTTGMGRGRRTSRGNEAVGPMPDTHGYRSTRPEQGNGGLGAAPRGEGPPIERCPDGRLVVVPWTVRTFLDCSYHGQFVPSLDDSYHVENGNIVYTM